MAHFAKISETNKVLRVSVINNSDILNAEGVEDESVGQVYLEQHSNWPAQMWIQTSYNTWAAQHTLGGTPFRGNYATIGDTWDVINQIFWAPQPHASWAKNNATASWVSPLGSEPSLTTEQNQQNLDGTHGWKYNWDESAYQVDNIIGWVLVDGLA